ncbi:MAG: hypothetical protein AAF125_20335, partial [Chloroflexota bacterium]
MVLLMRSTQPKPLTARRWAFIYLLATGLLFAHPVTVFTLPEQDLRWGYMATSFHNPPINLSIPFALAAVVGFVALLRPSSAARRWLALWTTAALLLAMTAKVNAGMSLLPAFALLTVVQGARGGGVPWWRLTAVIAAGGFILLVQALISALGETISGNGVAFMPFEFLDRVERADPGSGSYLAFKFALSALFPLGVYLAYFRTATRDLLFNAGWAVFGVSAIWNYLFIEDNTRWYHGNFTWNGEYGFTVLFAIASVFFMARISALLEPGRSPLTNPRAVLLLLVYTLHLLSGMLYIYVTAADEVPYWF